MRKINFVNYIREFGIKTFICKSLRHVVYKYDGKFAWKVNIFNEKLIESILFNNQTTESLPDLLPKNISININKPIFMMWYQGENQAPELVKTCIKSVRKYCDGHEVILIDKDNYENYVKIPKDIEDKFKSGHISKQHFADIIRCCLLYNYGGLWVDATVLFTSPISNDWFESKFSTINFGKYTKDPSHGRWTTFMMGTNCKQNILFEEILKYQFSYWRTHDQAVDYIMFDYFINYLSKTNNLCRSMIDSVLINNPDVFNLYPLLSCTATEENILKFNCMNKNTHIFKLNWRHQINNSDKTMWTYILNNVIN